MGFNNPLTAAQLASAIAATTLTVTGQVTTSPTTDEDDVRAYTQAQINALTATDKNTNFVIYNTTTNTVNYCVSGSIIVPATTAVQKAQGNYTGNAAVGRAIAVGFAPDLVLVSSSSSRFGLLHRADATTYQSWVLNGASTSATGPGLGAELLTSTGFTVGGTSSLYLNENSGNYYWTAWKFS